MPLARAVTRVTHEAAAVNRAHDWLFHGHGPALTSREVRERGQPWFFGDTTRSRPIPGGSTLDWLKRLNARLDHDPSSFLAQLAAERDNVADADLAQPASLLHSRGLRNVVEAVPGLEEQITLVSKLVRQAGTDNTAGDHSAGLDVGHHDGHVGIRETDLMTRAGLDDVATDLGLA
jgi:hypothetical protein